MLVENGWRWGSRWSPVESDACGAKGVDRRGVVLGLSWRRSTWIFARRNLNVNIR